MFDISSKSILEATNRACLSFLTSGEVAQYRFLITLCNTYIFMFVRQCQECPFNVLISHFGSSFVSRSLRLLQTFNSSVCRMHCRTLCLPVCHPAPTHSGHRRSAPSYETTVLLVSLPACWHALTKVLNSICRISRNFLCIETESFLIWKVGVCILLHSK